MLALLLAATVASPAPLPTPQTLPAVSVQAPLATLRLQVARTAEQRERGLMYVRRLPAHAGMVFVFDDDETVSFWMKDTLVPLDMIFVAADGRVRTVYPNVAPAASLPDDQIPIETATAKYVVELAGGDAARDGIVPGARLAGITSLR